MLLRAGQRVGDSYEVERYLGEGAFAEVYRVRHDILGRQAMKVFKRAGTVGEIREMLGEAILLSRIGHPNIVRVFHAGTARTAFGDNGFFTMEYVAGGNLQRFWVSHRDEHVPVPDVVRIVRQVAEGLAVAHLSTPAIVHRDITPQNILIGYDAGGLRARLSDFGLARGLNPLTMLASTRGTRAFKAPEALADPFGDSLAGDVWALGVICYLLLTDALPHEDRGPAARLGAAARTPPRPPEEFNPDVDPALSRIVMAALEPDLAARTPHAGALAAQLAQWQQRCGGRRSPQAVEPSPATTKGALGDRAADTEAEARRLAARARVLARQSVTLTDAADLMEAAFTKSPRLRGEHEHLLRMWRKGVMF
ncbi:serine/threonine-protein kinase [Actinokineospora sp. G85]|uniref:serine/threonine-protein kinase n=1 Tax=Actinokineospora sp. G85 TaxID=3406626 RepID=UPI003C712C82